MICLQYQPKVKKNLKLQTTYITLEGFYYGEIWWLKSEHGLIIFDNNYNYEKLKHSLYL